MSALRAGGRLLHRICEACSMQAGSPGQADAGLVGLLASYSPTRLQVRHEACLADVNKCGGRGRLPPRALSDHCTRASALVPGGPACQLLPPEHAGAV